MEPAHTAESVVCTVCLISCGSVYLYSYNPAGGWTSTHQMSINNKFDDITRKDLLDCASANGIKDASEIIDEVCNTIPLWPDIARDCGVPQQMIDGIMPNFIRL